MLEKPDIPDALILACLTQEFDLRVVQFDFLPLGADMNTAAYRARALDGTDWFVKLRKGSFDSLSLEVPLYLAAQGVRAVIPPRQTRGLRLWAEVGGYRLLLYPYIEGKNGYQTSLSPLQWREFGAALRQIHTAVLPPALAGRLPAESYSPYGRLMVRAFQAQVEQAHFHDPTAAKAAALMRAQRERITRLVERAEALALELQARLPAPVLCHSDLHAGNLLVNALGELFLVDWDAPSLGPKEKDLALVGGCPTWGDPRAVEWFYQGYGTAELDPAALTYFRCERAVQDIAAFCQQLLLSDEGGADREQSFGYFSGQFLPGGEIGLALGAEDV